MQIFSVLIYVVSKLPKGGRFQLCQPDSTHSGTKETDPRSAEADDVSSRQADPKWTDIPSDEDEDSEAPPEYLCFAKERIQSRGGLEALEYDLGDTCRWFSQLGQIEIPRFRGQRIPLPLKVIQPLIDNWVGHGRPKTEGWRFMLAKLCQEVERALTEDARRFRSTSPVFELLRTEPAVHKIPGVLERLDLGETVQVDLTVHMSCVGRHGSSIWLRRNKYVRQLCLWRDEGDDQFKVHVEIPNEAHAHPN